MTRKGILQSTNGALRRFISSTLACALVLSATGCASSGQTSATQVTYAQACAAYSGVFATALAARKAGKLSRAQIDQVTLLSSQVTPLCTGELPADTDAATVKITSAVASLTLIEVAQKAN